MKKILTGLFLLMSITCFSQTVKELEDKLRTGRLFGEMDGKKDIAYKLLQIDSFNSTAINYLINAYYMNNQKDSISYLYDRLIKENPNSPQPYLLRAKSRNLTYAQQMDFLKEAYKIDSLNPKVNYELGKLFYKLFINEFKENKNKENLDSFARNSIKYFSNLCNIDESYKEDLSYPLLQLANYLGDSDLKTLYETFNVQSSYFPLSEFVCLQNDWQTDYSIDVISGLYHFDGIESARLSINLYSNDLRDLKEPVLINSKSEKVFRFTWLRSFHNPIVIGIENTNNKKMVYWKELDVIGANKQIEIGIENTNNGIKAYSKEVKSEVDEAPKIIIDKSKELTEKEWTDIVSAMNAIKYWDLPSIQEDPNFIILDGAQWILEGKESGKYHVVDRSGGGEIRDICMQLINFTDLMLKSDEIY